MWEAIVAALAVVKAWLGLKTAKDENTQAVEVSNAVGAKTADTARDTRAQINKDEIANEQATDADVARVSGDGSLRDGSEDVGDVIARANSHASTNR